jgi:glycosyltransferase involved in cell wall biosynthesis
LAAIEAFQRAFPREADVALLLRCPDSDAFAPGKAALARRAAGDNRIRLLGRGEAAIGDFYSALDVFVSLHRSEGYGLQIVEALQSGASVVATRWGLSDAIVAHPRCRGLASRLCAVDDPQRVYSSIEGARWAEPDIDEAAAELRALHADHSADNHDQ